MVFSTTKDPTSNSMSPRKAAKACIACRDRKRKCDRFIPSCSLCYRLGRRCQYEPRVRLPSQDLRGSVISLPSRLHAPSISPLSSPRLFDDGSLIRASVNHMITDKLKHSIGDISTLRNAATKYFKSIHTWFPILSELSYYERLAAAFDKPCAEYSLLSLSMMLINTPPPVKETLDSFTSLYILVKSSIAIVEAANFNSVEIVQARLLVSLFEFGHGMPAAFISIAATARAAVAIGVNQTIKRPCTDVSATCSKLEEGLRVWWGIVMLDRNYTLERGEGPCATQDLGTPRHLPRDGSIWDQKILSSVEPLSLSTPSSVRVGPFARQAQVSHVLDILMMHLHDPKSDGTLDKEESVQIARTLTAFSLLLPEETPQPWPRYCGAIGMCYSALLTLHESRQDPALPIELGDDHCPESLASALNRINFIAGRFNEKIEQVDLEAISPFPPRSLYKGASIQYKLWKQTGDRKWLEASERMKLMLTHFSKRWMNAAKLLDQIEEDRKSYGLVLSNHSEHQHQAPITPPSEI
ncbi:hypothetical protein N431DRAFT_471753 [Stipitochalara longipes BDJ]|nr:hypothetical protein N431DRAFT_471753 [Stipitochalara longipes BDJ]